MRPTLEKIRESVLLALDLSEESYKRFSLSRRADIVAMKRLFCYVASEYGYSDGEIGRQLRLSSSTVLTHRSRMQDFINCYEGDRDLVRKVKKMMDNSVVVSGFIARDSDVEGGYLHFFYEEPMRDNYFWSTFGRIIRLEKDDYPDVVWENEPVKAELKIRLL